MERIIHELFVKTLTPSVLRREGHSPLCGWGSWRRSARVDAGPVPHRRPNRGAEADRDRTAVEGGPPALLWPFPPPKRSVDDFRAGCRRGPTGVEGGRRASGTPLAATLRDPRESCPAQGPPPCAGPTGSSRAVGPRGLVDRAGTGAGSRRGPRSAARNAASPRAKVIRARSPRPGSRAVGPGPCPSVSSAPARRRRRRRGASYAWARRGPREGRAPRRPQAPAGSGDPTSRGAGAG